MKNLSIRTRILASVVIVNLLGAIAVMVYLHESYSSELDVTATETLRQAGAGWEQIAGREASLDPVTQLEQVSSILGSMKEVTGADYVLLIDKATTDADTYAAARTAAGLGDNWDERDMYVAVSATDESVAERAMFEVDAGSVPEVGRVVGIENGACSKTCHETVSGEGDYWTVRWSTDSSSRAHAVYPVTDAANAPIGVLYAVKDVSQQANQVRSSMLRTLTVIGITLIAATLVIGGVVDTLVFKRLARTVESIQDLSVRVAGGDFDARFEPDGTTDEIGRFEEFFAKLMDLMSGTLKSLMEAKKK